LKYYLEKFEAENDEDISVLIDKEKELFDSYFW
jgi:hypothetical protein